MVWVVKKVWHIIKLFSQATVIYTNYGANVSLAKVTSLTTLVTDKLNLHLIHTSEYLQWFTLDIRHKPGKQHIVLDTLSCLTLALKPGTDISELNVLHTYAYTTSLVKMDSDFKTKLMLGYKKDPA